MLTGKVPEPTRKSAIGLFGLLVCVASTIFLFQLILWFPNSRLQSKHSSNSPDATPVAKIDNLVATEASLRIRQLPQSAKSPTTPPGANSSKSAGMQANREKLIQVLMETQVFQKAEVSGGVPRLWVGSRFYALDSGLKQIYVSAYAQYVGEGSIAELVFLYDGKTGIEIGRYSANDGELRIF
jgi:hypothetical protein